MDWAIRVKVAAGAARGIAYLHEDCNFLVLFLASFKYFSSFSAQFYYDYGHYLEFQKSEVLMFSLPPSPPPPTIV